MAASKSKAAKSVKAAKVQVVEAPVLPVSERLAAAVKPLLEGAVTVTQELAALAFAAVEESKRLSKALDAWKAVAKVAVANGLVEPGDYAVAVNTTERVSPPWKDIAIREAGQAAALRGEGFNPDLWEAAQKANTKPAVVEAVVVSRV